MKNHPLSNTVVLRALILAGLVLANSPGSAAPAAMRDSLTADQLASQRGLMEREDPMKKLGVAAGEDPAKLLPKDLISESDIISFGGLTTLVPKHAILQIPKNFAGRLKFVPGSEIKGWSDFYAVNRGWITTVEISLAQAEGKEPLPESTSQQLAKSGNLIVAVFRGGPVSMLPAKPTGEKANATTVQR